MNAFSKIRGIVTSLNDLLEKYKLKDIRVFREKSEETGETFVYLCAQEYSGVARSENRIGYQIADANDELITPNEIHQNLERMIDGGRFVLNLYGFDNHLERFKRLSEKLSFISRQFEIDDTVKIENYLWDNLNKLNIIASVKYEAQKIIGIDSKIALHLVPVAGEKDVEYLTFNFNGVVDKFGFEAVERFYQDWWLKQDKMPKDFIIAFNQPKAASKF